MHRFLSEPQIAAYEVLLGKPAVKSAVALTLDAARRSGEPEVPDFHALCTGVVARLDERRAQDLMPVVNATGILLHTNLGRAPLAPSAIEAVAAAAAGYTNLEFDVRSGSRGSRYARARGVLCSLTGAQDALVLNNCAAALLLVLDTFAKNREVVVARKELIEIGGGLRLPDVLARSGATLIEAGTANKVYAEDFARALSPKTALLLRCHPSNFRITGFTHDAPAADLAEIARNAGLPLVEDLGSGAVCDLAAYGLPHERTVQEALGAGVQLVLFSGDKLFGGPQAGVVLGSEALVARLRANPLLRALRCDKMTFAALIETARLHLNEDRRTQIPLYAMLGASLDVLSDRARRYAQTVRAVHVVETQAYAGGGALPQSALPSIGLALQPRDGATAGAAALRGTSPPIVARIENDRLLLDLRTILPAQDAHVTTALQAIA